MRDIRKLTLVAGVSAVALLTGLTGCSTWGHRSSDRTEGRMVDDHRITAQVKQGLADEPVYKFNDVDVRTFDGAVQLSGFVNTEDQKRRAGEIAQQTPGVAQVVNNISLKPNAYQPNAYPPTGRTP